MTRMDKYIRGTEVFGTSTKGVWYSMW